MKISTIALLAFCMSSSSTNRQVSAFVPRLQVPGVPPVSITKNSINKNPLRMISPNDGAVVSARYIVTFSTTIHSEEVNLESLSVPQLIQFHDELEKLNLACTEECTQTDPLCDIALKDERDYAMVQIQNLLHERRNDRLKNYVDMDVIRDMVKTPWTHSLSTIQQTVSSMETLNCECTEEGNQTNPACDVVLKDDRDAAIETLNLYMKSVRNLASQVSQEELRKTKESKRLAKKSQQQERSRNARVEQQGATIAAAATATIEFDMGEIRDCVNNPGSKNINEMKSMLTYLEAHQMACTEDATQTNAECDIEVKAERDWLMENLVSQITDAKICLNEIKAFATGDNINQMAIDDVMNKVMNAVPAGAAAVPSVNQNRHPGSSFDPPTDEYLVQI